MTLPDSELGQFILQQKWDGESHNETRQITVEIDGVGYISVYVYPRKFKQ